MDITCKEKALKKDIQRYIIRIKIAIILSLCINLSACKRIEARKISEKLSVEMRKHFCSIVFQQDFISFDEYIYGSLIRAEVKENFGKYLIVRSLNNDDLLGYDIDVGVSNIVKTSDIKPLDIVYICYDGMVLECVPPRISADAIFFSEKESVTYLWKQYIEYWPDFGIMLQ